MITDYPKLISTHGAVGFTCFETWFGFSAVKNNVRDALTLHQKGLPSFGAAHGEYEFYQWANLILEKVANVHIEKETEALDCAGIPIAFGPRILLDPSFGVTIFEIKSKF